MSDHRRDCWFRLNLLQFHATIPVSRLLANGGFVELCADPRALIHQLSPRARAAGAEERIRAFWKSGREERERDELQRRGWTWLCPDDAAYPSILGHIPDPPLVLYVDGVLPSDIGNRSVAVVGSRSLTPYGRQMADRMGRGLARHGCVVVSGLARGVDTVVHRSVVHESAGVPIAVLGCGLDRTYPTENSGLRREIANQGAILSEFPLGTPPRSRNFPLRNRIIAGLSRVTVVIEAGERSGSLITARLAAEQGRDVMAIPGDVGRSGSEGTNALIQQGAGLVRGPEDVIDSIGLDYTDENSGVESCSEQGLSRQVIDYLKQGPATVDELADSLETAIPQLVRCLYELELRNRVHRNSGDVYVVRDKAMSWMRSFKRVS